MEIYQHTIKHMHVLGKGCGIHSGVEATVSFLPAPPDTGIVFIRTDLPGCPKIPAHSSAVSQTQFCTVLNENHAEISTVEHLLSAVVGLGIDNLYVEVDGPEIPILDGSADVFLFALRIAGVTQQDVLRKYIKVNEEVSVSEGKATASLLPSENTEFSFTIDFAHIENFDHPLSKSIVLDTYEYTQNIARARTFGFKHDLAALKKAGLIKGATIENAILLDGGVVENDGGLRFPDELVSHKILDAIGDMFLLGHRVVGQYKG